jgi:ribosomal protein L16/L10AE
MEEGTITLTVTRDKPLTMRIDPKVLALDEKAGELMRMGHGYGNFEAATARVIEGHPWLGAAWAPDWRVTPARLEAWKRINEEVVRRLATLA